MIHRLLERQLRRLLTPQGTVDHEALLHVVSTTYQEFESTLRLQDHATQLMSDELNELNAAIRRERDEAVAESQKRFELAVKGTNDGIWDWNILEDTLWFSERAKAMLGYESSAWTEVGIAQWLTLVENTDRDKAASLLEQWKAGAPVPATTLRFVHRSGDLRFIMFRANGLQDQAGKIVRLVGVHTDITDIMMMQQELKTSMKKAEAANQAKSEFLANMSHELRTPMHAILGFSNLAIKKLEGYEDKKLIHMLQSITVSGNRLLHLLNELLDLSKLESGRTSIVIRKEDVRRAMEQSSLELEPLFLNKQIQLCVDYNDVDTVIPHDHKFMVQVFINILSNAIKFSPAGSEVSVRFCRDSLQERPALEIHICDKGIGVPEEEREVIFDKFAQSSKTRSGAGGTGLGLAIVREIIDAHRGKIWAHNSAQGGACFTMLLPYERLDVPSTLG